MATTPVVPANPAPATSAPASAPAPSAHSITDVMTNKLASAMRANSSASSPQSDGATPGPINPPLTATTPQTAAAPTTSTSPASAPGDGGPAAGAEPTFDFDSIDFDSPIPAETAPITEHPAPDQVAQPTQPQPDTPESIAIKNLYDSLEKGDMPEQLETALLRTTRGKEMLTSFKMNRELRKPVSEGGIGRVPTIDEIRAGDRAFQNQMMMKEEFANNPISFIHNLITVDPDTGQSHFGSVDNIRNVIRAIPAVLQEHLNSSDPQERQGYGALYSLYATPVFSNFLNYQYNVGLRLPEASQDQKIEKARYLDALQIIEWKVFGKARNLNLTPNGQQPTNIPDPEKQQMMNRIRQLEGQMQVDHANTVSQIQQSVESTADQGMLQDLDMVIQKSNLHKAYPKEILDPLKGQLHYEIKDLIKDHDPRGYHTYQVQLQQASRRQIDPSVPANTLRSLFRNALRGNSGIRERMERIVSGAKASLDAQTQSLAQSQGRVEPNGSGMVPRVSNTPGSPSQPMQLQRQPGENTEEFNARRIRAASEGMLARR